MQSLTCLLIVIGSSNVLQLRTSLSVTGVAENTWCKTVRTTLKIALKMYQATCQIARETGIHHSSVYSIVHQDFQLKC